MSNEILITHLRRELERIVLLSNDPPAYGEGSAGAERAVQNLGIINHCAKRGLYVINGGPDPIKSLVEFGENAKKEAEAG